MSVLAAPLSLGDPRRGGVIEDVEALVNKVIKDKFKKMPRGERTLDPHKREDLVAFLIGTCFDLSRRYDPKKDKKPNFAAYAAHICSFRIADWFRKEFGDTRHGERPIVFSLDAPATLEAAYEAGEVGDRLVDTIPALTGDPAQDSTPDLVGILNGRGGNGARANDAVREPAARRAARGNRAAGARKRVTPKVPPTFRSPRKPPVCSNCYSTFLRAFTKVNDHRPADERHSVEEIEKRALRRAQAVRFGDEWACPRCTKLGDPDKHQVMLGQAYPSRADRRAAHGKGVPQDRRKQNATPAKRRHRPKTKS